MASVPFALSIHHFVSSVGADAGFAAIIGLAILVMLFFAQARETANLRDQAYESAQRVGQLEARLAEVSRQQAAASQAQAAAGAAVPGAALARAATATPARAPAMFGAPAGVGAPALAAATRLIPIAAGNGPVPGVAQPREWPPEPVPVGEPASPAAATATAVAPAPAPATVAGGSNGHDRSAAPTAPPRPVGGVPTRAAGRSAGPGAARRPLVAPEPPRRRSRALRVLGFLVGVAVVAGGVAALLLVTSNKSGSQASTSAAHAGNAAAASQAKRAAAFNPRSVTVAVLNGTATTGLAHRTALRLAAAGYRQGTVATATDQTRTTTVVAYLTAHKNDALRVASTLKLPVRSVQPIDSGTQAVACPPPAPCTANVVVTVGADLASQ